MINIVVVYHSGYGHTKKQAEAVLSGLTADSGVEAMSLPIDAEGNIPDDGWESLAAADTIISVLPRTWDRFHGNLKNLRMHQVSSGLTKNGKISLLQDLPIHQE